MPTLKERFSKFAGLGDTECFPHLGFLAIGLGLSIAIGKISWNITRDSGPWEMQPEAVGTWQFWIVEVLGMTAAGLGICHVVMVNRHNNNNLKIDDGPETTVQSDAFKSERQRDKVRNALYRKAQVGLGYAMLIAAILNVIAFAGFAYNGKLLVLFPPGLDFNKVPDWCVIIEQHWVQTKCCPHTKPAADHAPAGSVHGILAAGEDSCGECKLVKHLPRGTSGVLLLVAAGMAILGALFFVVNSLRNKQNKKEDYDSHLFWSGLWYRLGESVLFTIVYFVMLRLASEKEGQYDFHLPIIALLLGMFVKTGEQLVFGFAQRIYAGAKALLPQDVGDSTTKKKNKHEPDDNEQDNEDQDGDGTDNQKPDGGGGPKTGAGDQNATESKQTETIPTIQDTSDPKNTNSTNTGTIVKLSFGTVARDFTFETDPPRSTTDSQKPIESDSRP